MVGSVPRAPAKGRLWTPVASWLQPGCSLVLSHARSALGTKPAGRGAGVERLAALGRAAGGVEELGGWAGVAARAGVAGAGRPGADGSVGLRDGVGRAGGEA